MYYGSSGKGKTTLLRILIGLEKADNGKITGMEGKDISVVFQEDRLCENLNVLSNIRLVQEKKKEGKQEFLKKVQKGLEEVGLLECSHQPVKELSGGMKRRVAILRALYAKWDILFFRRTLQRIRQRHERKGYPVFEKKL